MAIWTIQAQRQLRHSLAMELCQFQRRDRSGCLHPLQSKMDQLDRILACTFPRADNVVVRSHLTGFRRKKDRYVLLVEVDEPEQGGPYVVKIGPPSKLAVELNGWNCCRPAGLKHDLVLLPLELGCYFPSEEDAQWMSLVYGDAQQFIGAETSASFEEAFLGAVEHGQPTITSVGYVLVQLLERLGHVLYATSFVEDVGADDYVFDMPKVSRAVTSWQREPFHRSIRTDTNVLVRHGASHFIDPVDYFEQWIFPYFSSQHRAFGGRQEKPDFSSPPAEELAAPQPHDLVPYMLRGCAHGDLHGRNILVGLVEGQAMWPTVFDYEDMQPSNYLGWDFVKLETELKIRAYAQIMARDELTFLKNVHDFEISLNEATERHHLDASWPLLQESHDPRERLHGALLELRRIAALHLGKNRGRARQWLEEFYFLLSAYGVNTATYKNLDRRELIAAYISAGAATARLSWPRQREPAERVFLGI